MSKRPSNIDNNLDDLDLESISIESDYDDDMIYKNGNGVLLFKDKKYAVGLTWLTSSEFEDDGSVYKKAKSISCDFYCTRAFISQNGFGTIQLKHKMGMPSASAMAADALVGEWHGVFVADNGWLYVAVHADNIAPDGDIFFLSEEEAYNHFVSQATNYKWPKTYVPEAWNVNNNDGEISLEKILEDVSSTSLKPANLDAFFGSAANKSLAIISLLILCGFLALISLSQSLFTQIIPERATVPSQQLNISEVLIVPPKEPVFEKDPLELLLEQTSLPVPEAIVRLCVESFDGLMVPIPGWDIRKMRCRGNLVEGVWGAGVGSLETLRSSLDQFPFGISKTYGSNGDFLASKIIAGNSYDRPLRLSTREDILFKLNDNFATVGTLQVRDIAPKLSDNNTNNSRARGRELISDKPEVMTLQNLPSLGATIKTDISPMEIKENFNLPGLRFNVIEWDIVNGGWLYDLQVYLYPANYKKE